MTSRWVVTVRLRSAAGSRRVRKTVVLPGRREIWATWPSTQTQPSRPIHSLSRWLTTRTGQGCSGVLRGTGEAGCPAGWLIPGASRGRNGTGPRRSRGDRTGRVVARRPARTMGQVGDGMRAGGGPGSGRKRVLLAKPRGYCAGVDRAVQTVEEALNLYGPPIYVRKQIVHNKHVVATLEERGAIFVEETDEVPEGAIVVFSAHGVAPEVYEQARERNLRAIDAT